MKFRATLRTAGGTVEKRAIEAPSRFAVYELAQKEGATVVDLAESGRRIPPWLLISIGTGITRAEIIRLAKNLSAMLAAGLSLSRALSVIERQSGNKRLKKTVSGVAALVEKGSTFHEALAAYPKVFPAVFVAMVKAGEESGSLAQALSTVSLQMDRAEELSRKVRGAMIYPAIVIGAVIIVGVLMLTYVVPVLTKTFTELNVPLPLATQIIVAISDFMAAHATLVFFGLLALLAGGVAFVRSDRGSRAVLWAALRVPIIGELVRETYSARAARTISSLLSAGVSVLEALSITKDVVHAGAFVAVIDEAGTRVKKGEPLSAAFAEHPALYPILLSDMLEVGEETGKVAEMLTQIAEFYEQDVAERTKDLSTVIEPVLMLFIGSVVGVFAVSMIAPIYSLSSAI